MNTATKGKIRALIQNNRLVDAEKLCASLCRKDKSDAEAWFLLGSIHGQTGALADAIDCLRRSISIHGKNAMSHYNLGLNYYKSGLFEDARNCFETALEIDPVFTAARADLANTLQAQGSFQESIAHYETALGNAPGSLAILMNLASAYAAIDEPGKAIELLQQLLHLDPSGVDTHFRIGTLLHRICDYEGAVRHFRIVLEHQPDRAEALVNLGNAQLQLNHPDQAIASYKNALKLQGNSADILFNLGNALRAADQLEEAESTYLHALELQPKTSGILNNLGLVFHARGDYENAAARYEESLDVDRQQTDAYINLANCYRDQRDPEHAIATLEKALSVHPDNPQIHGDLSLLLLASGLFARGWDEYEWRWHGKGMHRRSFPVPVWKGEPAVNKTILVTAEQGIGDEIMFASCFPDLIRSCGHVVIDCEPRLAPLFSRSFSGTTVHAGKQSSDLSWINGIPSPDFEIPAGSLPRHYRRQLRDFPDHTGYLVADPDNTERWRQRYAEYKKKLNVGISWKGGHISKAAIRSTALEDWQDILGMQEICFINLQYGNVQSELDAARSLHGITIHHWDDSDPLIDMDNFAAQIAAVDLVISVDNSTVHLAGALGIKTWVMQPCIPDWRWLNYSRGSHWYPSVQQFHQSSPNEWSNLLGDVKNQLALLLNV